VSSKPRRRNWSRRERAIWSKTAQCEIEVSRCNDELDEIRENALRLKREMDNLRDELFGREEEEAIIIDDAHVVTDGEGSQTGSEAKLAWDARAKHLKQVR
jgi:hypothetical protein